MQSALLANGIKPINNVVDISNYVLLEYGTPLHMFDAKKVKTNHIIIRSAKAGEEVVTLDDQTCKLVEGDVVITNGEEAIAIGGVMGLKNTMIDDFTKDVILEAAYFDPKHIRKTSHRLDLRSDSSLRFERGIDDQRVLLGMERATALLIELADAKVSQNIAKHILYELEPKVITISHQELNAALGIHLTMDEVVSYLKRYHYSVEVNESVYLVKAPSYRNDIEIKADVIEEIARIYGLNHIPMQTLNDGLKGGLTLKQKRLRTLRHQLAFKGLNEIISYTLVKEDEVNKYRNLGKAVSILMPLSEDKKTLRQSLINGLLETVRYNQARQIDDIAIFEIGHVFAEGVEKNVLGLAMSGNWHQNKWQKQALKVDFYLAKGILEDVFKILNITFTFEATDEIKTYHPGRQAKVLHQNRVLGYIAEIHPKESKRLDIESTVVLEIDIDELMSAKIDLEYNAVSRFPSIFRDIAMVVNDQENAEKVINLIKQTARDILVDIQVFDVYQGSHIETGFKSMAFSLEFNHHQQTLDSETVDKMMKKIEKRLQFEINAVIRN
jgi:phenylalanyl-tRNA synthetase beta chain